MDKISNELCPICIESPIQYYTECNHGYCINCLSRIKKCAMCRNLLQRAKICIQIKQKFNSFFDSDISYFNTATHQQLLEDINIYSFNLTSSKFGSYSRIGTYDNPINEWGYRVDRTTLTLRILS